VLSPKAVEHRQVFVKLSVPPRAELADLALAPVTVG
jgi:hypothetical protein